jgi:hypothetical protein
LRQVEQTERMRQKASAPASLQNAPEIFLLDLEHAQVALRLIVLEGDGQITEEGEHGFLSQPESFQEVAGWGLLDPATSPLVARRRGIGSEAGGQERFVAGDEGLAERRGELVRSRRARLLDRCLHLQQQRLAYLGPGLLILLLEESQFAQVMDIAQRMLIGGMSPIGRLAVMHAHPSKERENANSSSGFSAALGMDPIMRELACARHMRPRRHSRSAHSCLVTVSATASRNAALICASTGVSVSATCRSQRTQPGIQHDLLLKHIHRQSS